MTLHLEKATYFYGLKEDLQPALGKATRCRRTYSDANADLILQQTRAV